MFQKIKENNIQMSVENKKLWEIQERERINQSSLKILKRVREKYPYLYKYELEYQKYRTKFSDAYFRTSDWYRGDSLIEFWEKKSFSDKIFDLMYNFK